MRVTQRVTRQIRLETPTSKFRLPGAIAALSTMIATPVFAQTAIQEPGAYAFYHPNASLGLESARPATEAMASLPIRNGGARMAIHRGSRETHHR
jgi:hypothetical protein